MLRPCLILALLLAAGPPAHAADPAAPDSAAVTAIPADSAGVDTVRTADVPPDTAAIFTIPPRAPRTLPEIGRFDQPKWVMFRSMLIPGWGQAHNGAWLKAGVVAAGDGALRVYVFREQRELGDLNDAANQNQVELFRAESELAAAEAAGDSVRIAAARQAHAAALDAYNASVIAYNTKLEGSIARRWLMVAVILYSMIDAYVDAHFKSFDVNLDVDPALTGKSRMPGARLRLRWKF